MLSLFTEELVDALMPKEENLNKYIMGYDLENERKELTVNELLSLFSTNNEMPETIINPRYRQYVTAIKSKPFLLLAGISGTGKSRIVRELARSCWDEGSEEYEAQKPRNFEMVQVKPNWHDSSELIGYVSRVSGQSEYVAGEFLRFIAKAWKELDVPYFLCLDEMNLAPVEQYFAEYLSVVESRKNRDGVVITDPIMPAAKMRGPGGVLIPHIWYSNLVDELLSDCPKEKELELKSQFTNDGISLPPNLIVVGTVNMDETTFSFSRKVLDRAMTIEMNEVDLAGGLDSHYEKIGKLGAAELIGTAVEGVDVYGQYKSVCDNVIKYLEAINRELDKTPFKIAYRTRNEALLYVVNNLPYKKEEESEEEVIRRALDEITNMKILSRIEGDADKIGNLLERLSKVIKEQLGEQYTADNSVSLKKLEEMEGRLKSGYTSFWS
jgi:MoxR-like ATPase